MAFNILYNYASNEERALEFPQRNLLLRSEYPECQVCNCFMTVVKTGRGDRCPTHKGEKVFFTKDTFFENSQLSFKNIEELLFCWAFKEPVAHASVLIGLSTPTIIQWYSYFRDVCSHWLLKNPYTIGGPGQVVEIDESLVARRKANVGRLVPERWVFGGVERATNRGFLVEVLDRTADILLRCIRENIAPGTIIHSDGFSSYNNVVNIPVVPRYQHLVFIHQYNFVDPITGACTNKVENYWKNAKRRFKYFLIL